MSLCISSRCLAIVPSSTSLPFLPTEHRMPGSIERKRGHRPPGIMKSSKVRTMTFCQIARLFPIPRSPITLDINSFFYRTISDHVSFPANPLFLHRNKTCASRVYASIYTYDYIHICNPSVDCHELCVQIPDSIPSPIQSTAGVCFDRCIVDDSFSTDPIRWRTISRNGNVSLSIKERKGEVWRRRSAEGVFGDV